MPTTFYEYPDKRGRVLLRKKRYYVNGKKKFSMQARSREDYAWTNQKGLERKYPNAHDYFHSLLYGLPLLLDALAEPEHDTVYWCEGEKDADSINNLPFPGGVGVSHWQGARNATEAQARLLRAWRGDVVVCLDQDEAGAVCAWLRYGHLRAAGIPESRIRVVRAAGPRAFGSGRDITDHLQDGYGLDALVTVDLHRLEKYARRRALWRSLHGSGSTESDGA